MQPWSYLLEAILTHFSTTEMKEPKLRPKLALPPPKNSSRETLELQNLSRGVKTSIFKPINLLRSSRTKLLATRLGARRRSRLRGHRLLGSCQRRRVSTKKHWLKITNCSYSILKLNPYCQCFVERHWSCPEWRCLRRRS